MPDKTGKDRSDSDPSFIRPNAQDLFTWARRLGMSPDQLRDAVDGGLIRPTASTRPAADKPNAADSDRPDIAI